MTENNLYQTEVQESASATEPESPTELSDAESKLQKRFPDIFEQFKKRHRFFPKLFATAAVVVLAACGSPEPTNTNAAMDTSPTMSAPVDISGAATATDIPTSLPTETITTATVEPTLKPQFRPSATDLSKSSLTHPDQLGMAPTPEQPVYSSQVYSIEPGVSLPEGLPPLPEGYNRFVAMGEGKPPEGMIGNQAEYMAQKAAEVVAKGKLAVYFTTHSTGAAPPPDGEIIFHLEGAVVLNETWSYNSEDRVGTIYVITDVKSDVQPANEQPAGSQP